MAMVCKHFSISGRVQGVWFRASTRETAIRLGLNGWVRNTPEGRVEAVACGESHKVDALEKWLWQGPPAAEVKRVISKEIAWETYTDFTTK